MPLQLLEKGLAPKLREQQKPESLPCAPTVVGCQALILRHFQLALIITHLTMRARHPTNGVYMSFQSHSIPYPRHAVPGGVRTFSFLNPPPLHPPSAPINFTMTVTRKMRLSPLLVFSTTLVIPATSFLNHPSTNFCMSDSLSSAERHGSSLNEKAAGSFFNQVPEEKPENEEEPKDLEDSLQDLLKKRNAPPLASQPSTINGIPTSQAGQGFGKNSKAKSKESKDEKPFVAIGPPVNDVTKPEYDDQGYTVYTNEQTGEKSRVFEALVEYPCDFTMKIVGANEGAFVQEMVGVVAEACNVDTVPHSVKENGKWTSITVKAPVQNAEMLYSLYEKVDRDPRVKFKF